MPVLAASEIKSFLGEPGHLARIATVDADGVPLVVPVWFIAEDERVYITPRARSEWWQHLQERPYACVTIDEEALPWRKVVLRGAVEVVHGLGQDDLWRDLYRRIACRYVNEEGADAYLHNTRDEPRALVSIALTQAKSWRMPVSGERSRQVWAERYYHS